MTVWAMRDNHLRKTYWPSQSALVSHNPRRNTQKVRLGARGWTKKQLFYPTPSIFYITDETVTIGRNDIYVARMNCMSS